jgi:hypothetical protein
MMKKVKLGVRCPKCNKLVKLKANKHDRMQLYEADWRELIGDAKVDALILKDHKCAPSKQDLVLTAGYCTDSKGFKKGVVVVSKRGIIPHTKLVVDAVDPSIGMFSAVGQTGWYGCCQFRLLNPKKPTKD